MDFRSFNNKCFENKFTHSAVRTQLLRKKGYFKEISATGTQSTIEL